MKPKSVTIYIDEETGMPVAAGIKMKRQSKVKQGESWRCKQLGTLCKVQIVFPYGRGHRIAYQASNVTYSQQMPESKFLKSYKLFSLELSALTFVKYSFSKTNTLRCDF